MSPCSLHTISLMDSYGSINFKERSVSPSIPVRYEQPNYSVSSDQDLKSPEIKFWVKKYQVRSWFRLPEGRIQIRSISTFGTFLLEHVHVKNWFGCAYMCIIRYLTEESKTREVIIQRTIDSGVILHKFWW